MLFKGSKSTQTLLTKQGYSLCTHTHTRYCGTLLHNLTLCQENWGAGKTIPVPVLQRSLRTKSQWLTQLNLHPEGTAETAFDLLKEDYLESVLEQRHTRTLMLLTKHLNNGEWFQVSCLNHCHIISVTCSSPHSCLHLCVTFIPLKEHFQWGLIAPQPFRPSLELPFTAFRFVVKTSLLPLLYSS